MVTFKDDGICAFLIIIPTNPLKRQRALFNKTDVKTLHAIYECFGPVLLNVTYPVLVGKKSKEKIHRFCAFYI